MRMMDAAFNVLFKPWKVEIFCVNALSFLQKTCHIILLLRFSCINIQNLQMRNIFLKIYTFISSTLYEFFFYKVLPILALYMCICKKLEKYACKCVCKVLKQKLDDDANYYFLPFDKFFQWVKCNFYIYLNI